VENRFSIIIRLLTDYKEQLSEQYVKFRVFKSGNRCFKLGVISESVEHQMLHKSHAEPQQLQGTV